MKVVRNRIGVALVSAGLLSGILGLTAVMTSSATSGIVVLAGASASTVSSNATVIEP
jgi:hypothetical protein